MGLTSRASGRFSAFRRGKLYARAARFGQSYGNRLLGRTSAVFSFADVMHFFAHKLARLSAWRFSLFLVPVRSFDYFFFWHYLISWPWGVRFRSKEPRIE